MVISWKSIRREWAGILGAGTLAFIARDFFKTRSFQLTHFPFGLAATTATLALWPHEPFSFKNKSVVITGGSRGLGFSLAEEFLNEGALVTLLARDGDELERAKYKLDTKYAGHVFVANCDVTKGDSVETALAEASARFGGVDVLVHNAGSVAVGPFETFDDFDFTQQLGVHLKGAINATRAIRPYFRFRGGGRIVYISSIGGKIGVPHMSSYSASKFALAGFADSMRAELSQDNVIVTTAYPGLMRTGSPKQGFFKGESEEEFVWFATADNTPGLSMSPNRAARQIIEACRRGQVEAITGAPARLGVMARALLPETTAALLSITASFLPKAKEGNSRVHLRKKGVASRGLFDSIKLLAPFRAIERRAQVKENQLPT